MSVDLKTPPALSQDTEEELRVEDERRDAAAEYRAEKRDFATGWRHAKNTVEAMREAVKIAADKTAEMDEFRWITTSSGVAIQGNDFVSGITIFFAPVRSVAELKQLLKDLMENLG